MKNNLIKLISLIIFITVFEAKAEFTVAPQYSEEIVDSVIQLIESVSPQEAKDFLVYHAPENLFEKEEGPEVVDLAHVQFVKIPVRQEITEGLLSSLSLSKRSRLFNLREYFFHQPHNLDRYVDLKNFYVKSGDTYIPILKKLNMEESSRP